jgi:hypothetical protein
MLGTMTTPLLGRLRQLLLEGDRMAPDELERVVITTVCLDPRAKQALTSQPWHRDFEDFESWYARYPRKQAKADAIKAWTSTAGKRPPLAQMIETLAWQVQHPDWTKDGGKFIPHPGRYLRAGRWADERPKTASIYKAL